jgi:hypothetical protein
VVETALLVRQVLQDLHELLRVRTASNIGLLTLLPELLESPGKLHTLAKGILPGHQSI